MLKQYYVYILTNKHHTTLYVGVTNDIVRRTGEHKTGMNKSFTQKYNCHKLVWYEIHHDIRIAIKREKTIKKWKRQWKENIITDCNPNWDDLSDGWYD